MLVNNSKDSILELIFAFRIQQITWTVQKFPPLHSSCKVNFTKTNIIQNVYNQCVVQRIRSIKQRIRCFHQSTYQMTTCLFWMESIRWHFVIRRKTHTWLAQYRLIYKFYNTFLSMFQSIWEETAFNTSEQRTNVKDKIRFAAFECHLFN